MTRAPAASWALFSWSLLACGGGDNTLGGPDDASTSDTSTSDVTTSDLTTSDASGDAAIGDAGADSSGVDVGEGGEAGDAAPYLGSMPSPVTTALLRFANWSPDSPAVDVCMAPHGSGAFRGPLVAALASATQTDAGAAGIAFPLVSAYVLVDPGQYDVRVVVAGASTCAVGVTHDATALPALQLGAAATFALIGEAGPSLSGAYKLRVTGFLDDQAALDRSSVAIRVINAAPELARVDVGTGSIAAANFVPIFQGVPVGMVGPAVGARLLVDANGYGTAEPLSNVILSAHAKGTPTDAVVATTPISASAGTVMTIAVTGGLAGSSATLVACFDNAGTAGTLASCDVWGPPAGGM